MAIAKSGRALAKNEKILLGIVMVMSISFLYWTLLLEPEMKKMKPLQEEVKVLKSQLKDASTIEKNIKVKGEELAGLKTEYDEATKIISKTDRYPQLIKDIREVASSNNVKIASESLGRPTVYIDETAATTTETPVENVASGLQTMSIALTLEGDFNNVLAFINKLEEDKRILEVQGFTSTDKGTTVNLMYYIAGGEEIEEYDFNSGTYGKDNLFN